MPNEETNGQEPNEVDETNKVEPPAKEPVREPAGAPVEPAPKEGAGNELPEWAVAEQRKLRDEAAQNRVRLRDEQAKWEGGKTAAEVAELEKRIRTLEAEMVLVEAGHPRELAERLRGNTAEELKADMESLLGSLPRARRVAGGLDPASQDGGETVAQRVARLRK